VHSRVIIALMRRLGVVMILLCACGRRADRDPAHVHDAGVRKAASDGGAALAVPAVAVVIARDGALSVGRTGGSVKPPTGTTPVASLDALPVSLLELLAVGTGDLAEHAGQMRAELEQDPENREAPAEDEVAMTYFDVPGAELPAVTPLVIVDPDAPGTRLAEVLDRVGGVVAIGRGDDLQVLRFAAPWDNAGYGGVDLEYDTPAYNVQVGASVVVISGDWQEDESAAEQPLEAAAIAAEVARLRPGAAEPLGDVLVTDRANAQHVVDAVLGLAAAGVTTIGVGVSPFPYPT
jgi:hypothetical protein